MAGSLLAVRESFSWHERYQRAMAANDRLLDRCNELLDESQQLQRENERLRAALQRASAWVPA